MSDLFFFSDDPPAPLEPHAPAFPASIPNYDLPTDDFNVPSDCTPYTTYYLTVTTPHLDTWTIHGPGRTFRDLIPYITDVISNSPSAIEKVDALRANPNSHFDKVGFNTLIVEFERGTYSTLKVLREVNERVYNILPSSIYVVTSHGPLAHDIGYLQNKVQSGKRKGMVEHSRLVGSFVDVNQAREAARRSIEELIRDEERVMRTERQEQGVLKNHCFLAMSARCTWEVRTTFQNRRDHSVDGSQDEWWII